MSESTNRSVAMDKRAIALRKKLLGSTVEEAKLVEEGLPCGEKLPNDPIGVSYAYFYNSGMKRPKPSK